LRKGFTERKKLVYDFICDVSYIPMKFKEIAVLLQVPKDRRRELHDILDLLEEEGKVSLTAKGKYIKGSHSILRGTYQGNPKGFGFVLPDEEGQADIFIAGENNKGAMDGDQVEYMITCSPEGKRKEGYISRIVSRGVVQVVGLFEKNQSFGFVRPDNQKMLQDIYIPEGKWMGAVTGQKVVAELTSYGEKDKKPEGRIIEIIGFANAPGTDILSIVKDYGLPVEFPVRVCNQAERVGKDVSAADIMGRMDLRNLDMVTIDGEDAKDLDDAVSLVRDGENYVLGVHIADVANYVQEGSALDKEALRRGTSVYLVDRVIPMLPPKLSNGICSLNAHEDRLALSCIMTVNPKGEVINHALAETVIQVNKRMTYTAVAKILEEQDAQEMADNQERLPMFEDMRALSLILRERRRNRGSIHFDFPETKMVLDEDGVPVEIKAYEVNTATCLIEDFMLLANETVAEEYYWRELPFLYRSHEIPDEEKMKKLSFLVHNFGFHMRVNEEIHPMEIQKLLNKIAGTPQEAMISRLTLRSMRQARYTTENAGHFGLAAKYYTHFTSPIRRYPDLQIHRIIKENIRGRLNQERIAHYAKRLPEVALQSSTMERRAEEAERETIKLKKAEYMKGHIGDVFVGVISGVTRWGIYVELPNTIEGMVHVTNLTDDFYEYDEVRFELVGEATGKVFRLGQQVMISVLEVDTHRRTIDFELMEERYDGLSCIWEGSEING